jgi:hypothetical protein
MSSLHVVCDGIGMGQQHQHGSNNLLLLKCWESVALHATHICTVNSLIEPTPSQS